MRKRPNHENSLPLRLTGTPGGSVHLTGREACIRGSKLDVDRAQLCRLTGAPHRRLSSELLELFHRRAARHLKRRPDRPRRDGVDPDAVRRELLRQGFYVIHGCSFCLRVVVQVRGWIIRLLRGGADDDRAEFEVRERRFNDPERRVDIRLHRRIEILRQHVED